MIRSLRLAVLTLGLSLPLGVYRRFLAVLLWLVGLAFAHAHPLFDRFPDELAEVFDLARRFFPEFFEHGRVYRKAVGTAKTLLRSKLIFVVGCELTAGHCDDRQRTFLGQ